MNSYLRAALHSFTWRRVLLTQAAGLVVAGVMGVDWGYFGAFIGHTSLHFVTVAAYALLLLPVAYCADEAIVRGTRPMVVYAILLIVVNQAVAALVAAATLWIYLTAYAMPWPARHLGFMEASSHFSVPCSFALLIFLNGRAAERMLEGVRGAELRRVKLDQQLVESRLATAEAQIDPQMLFSELAQIKQGLESSQPGAEKKLNDLIQTLRAALARTRAVTTQGDEP